MVRVDHGGLRFCRFKRRRRGVTPGRHRGARPAPSPRRGLHAQRRVAHQSARARRTRRHRPRAPAAGDWRELRARRVRGNRRDLTRDGVGAVGRDRRVRRQSRDSKARAVQLARRKPRTRGGCRAASAFRARDDRGVGVEPRDGRRVRGEALPKG